MSGSIHTLPQPDVNAIAISAALQAQIHSQILRNDNWMSFADYMQAALYTPGLGYYSGQARKFGPQGDFITAPEITPLFGQALTWQIAQVCALSASNVIEIGAGTGNLAADILLALEQTGVTLETYSILEVSADLQARQYETLHQRAPHLLNRVTWLQELPQNFRGCVIANEVLDVMPVHLLVWRDGTIFERGVSWQENQLSWADKPAPDSLLNYAQQIPVTPPSQGEYVSEICPIAQAWVSSWTKCLEQGALLLIDYGYPRTEYYLPSRSTGTLLCYYQHRAHSNPLLWPGLCDITSFVDFTAIAESAFASGLDVLGYTTQAQFLINCGLLAQLEQRPDKYSPAYIRAARAAQRLIAPNEMGELFKVLMLGNKLNFSQAPLGFAHGDKLHAL